MCRRQQRGLPFSVALRGSVFPPMPTFSHLLCTFTSVQAGDVEDAEMLRTFNMGIGYVLVVAPDVADLV